MPGQDLTLRRTVIGGDRLENDFCVYRDGRSIGRIRLAANHVEHIDEWQWFVNPPLPVPSWATGAAATFEDAKADFRAAWERFYASLTPDDIAHWHKTADAAKRWG
jgi:hypothetical protein